jgi:hypothetical protein
MTKNYVHTFPFTYIFYYFHIHHMYFSLASNLSIEFPGWDDEDVGAPATYINGENDVDCLLIISCLCMENTVVWLVVIYLLYSQFVFYVYEKDTH